MTGGSVKKHLREIISALEGMGCAVEADTTRRHYRLEVRLGDRRASLTVPGSPMNDHDAVNLAMQDARRALGLINSTPRRPCSSKKKRRRHHRRRVTVATPSAPIAPERRDPWAELTSHALAPAVLEMRLQDALKALWGDICMVRWAAPSVAATMWRRPARDY